MSVLSNYDRIPCRYHCSILFQLAVIAEEHLFLSIDETWITVDDGQLPKVFHGHQASQFTTLSIVPPVARELDKFRRTSLFPRHNLFYSCHAEHEMIQYSNKL